MSNSTKRGFSSDRGSNRSIVGFGVLAIVWGVGCSGANSSDDAADSLKDLDDALGDGDATGLNEDEPSEEVSPECQAVLDFQEDIKDEVNAIAAELRSCSTASECTEYQAQDLVCSNGLTTSHFYRPIRRDSTVEFNERVQALADDWCDDAPNPTQEVCESGGLFVPSLADVECVEGACGYVY